MEKINVVNDWDSGFSRGAGSWRLVPSEAEKAIATLNGTDQGGRTLTINEAQPKSDRPRGGGQRFGGGGGAVGATTIAAMQRGAA